MANPAMVAWLNTFNANDEIEWSDYCNQAGIAPSSGHGRDHTGFINERNSFRDQINQETLRLPVPYTIQPTMIVDPIPNAIPRRGLIKVMGVEQLEDRINHYETRVSNTHIKHRKTMKILRKDPTLGNDDVNRIDRLTYAADVVHTMFEKSLAIARNTKGKLTKLPSTSVKRIAEQSIDVANDNKKNGI